MTRVIVADDHSLFREGVITLLGQLLPEARIV
jgi:DNA-binding NarL/FixJ family response regulator